MYNMLPEIAKVEVMENAFYCQSICSSAVNIVKFAAVKIWQTVST